MTRTVKKVGALLLIAALSVVLALPSFAATTRSATGYSFSSAGNTAYQLNAATWGTPSSGTKVTTWVNDGSATQRWRQADLGMSGRYWLVNDKSPNTTVSYQSNTSQAVLLSANAKNASTQAIRFVNEGMGTGGYIRYGLVLPDYLIALTASSYSNGGAVNWQGSNGQLNQLWYIGMYY